MTWLLQSTAVSNLIWISLTWTPSNIGQGLSSMVTGSGLNLLTFLSTTAFPFLNSSIHSVETITLGSSPTYPLVAEQESMTLQHQTDINNINKTCCGGYHLVSLLTLMQLVVSMQWWLLGLVISTNITSNHIIQMYTYAGISMNINYSILILNFVSV